MSTAENANSFKCIFALNETKNAQLFISESKEICGNKMPGITAHKESKKHLKGSGFETC